MGGNSNTGKYKSWKEVPLWLKIVIVGSFVLVIGGMLTHFIDMENRDFDAQLEKKIERIHGQIAEGQFREVFLEGDRELVANYDENEFTAKLAKARGHLTGKHQKMNGSSLRYTDVYNRLKRLFGQPALASSYYSFKTETLAGSESFYWILRGDEIRLADYDFKELNRKDYR